MDQVKQSSVLIATFFLDKKSSQKSQDGGILSTHKAGAGPVRRHSSPQLTYKIYLWIEGSLEFDNLQFLN
jgi:hypothetical protein